MPVSLPLAVGAGFSTGFQAFRESGKFCDVIVTLTSDGTEYPLHLILLANRCAFGQADLPEALTLRSKFTHCAGAAVG